MKVYIVTKEEYDYSYSESAILKIFFDEQKANDFRARCELISKEYIRTATVVSKAFNEWVRMNPRPEAYLTKKSSKKEHAAYLEKMNKYAAECLAKREQLEAENLRLSDEAKELAKKYILNGGYSVPTFTVTEHDVEE